MILATHALTGAVIGKNVNNIWAIIILSLAVHFIMDTFRHGEYSNRNSTIKETARKVILDILAGFLIILAIAYSRNFEIITIKNVIIGAFFSILPDSFTFLYWKMGVKFLKPLFDFHAWLHLYPPFSPERNWNLRNTVNDVVISVVAIILLLI